VLARAFIRGRPQHNEKLDAVRANDSRPASLPSPSARIATERDEQAS